MNQIKQIKVCMIVPDENVKGGIATIVNGYRSYDFGEDCKVSYVESYCNGSKFRKLIKATCGYIQFIKELCVNRPDIVHIHSSFGPSFWRKLPFIFIADWRNIPVINHIHGAEFDCFYENASNRKKQIIRKVYCKCRILIALSEEWRSKLKLIVPENKIVVIENYCIIPELIAAKKKQMLFLGEIGERKGCFDIPAIYAEILKKWGQTPLLIGGDGEIEKMQRLLGERNVADEVSFLGWVRGREKDKILQESSIFLFPSYNEGMPVVLLEAMAYGLAIVTTNVGGIPQLIDHGVDGYICKPGDICDMAEKVIELLENDARRASFGNAAREKAIAHFGLEKHLERLCDLYRELLRGWKGAF